MRYHQRRRGPDTANLMRYSIQRHKELGSESVAHGGRIAAGLAESGGGSPQLSSTLVWCLSHVTHPYVHLTEDSYDQVSLPLLSVFGKDAPSSQWLCVFLLDKLLGPLHQRFSSLVLNPNLRPGESHSPATIRELLCLLEALCGLALNTRPALIQVWVGLYSH
ncbi:Exportin-4 [Geodia barretti]|uniref:Exportin-4 n=1 Tax=Geodia barretti TaxID=519541 RepID=A0AA35QX64_GEOBA|nr:Exportin-4 [Geodia barretti]